jgi:hypothetical protein
MKISSTIASFLLERIENDRLGVHARVRAKGQGFEGGNPSVWFEHSAIADFMAALVNLETSRQGAAEIESMSPAECRLRIRSIDRAGHLAVDVVISRNIYLNGHPQRNACELVFEIDPSTLQRIVLNLSEALIVA